MFIPNINLVSYADDNTLFEMGSSALKVIHEIKTVAECLTLWFRNNCIKVNPDKFHFLLSGKKIHQVDICNDNKLTFEEHVERLCKKSQSKSQCSGKNFIFNEI